MEFNDQLARSAYDREQDAITIDRLKNLLTEKATFVVESLMVKIYFIYKIAHAFQLHKIICPFFWVWSIGRNNNSRRRIIFGNTVKLSSKNPTRIL